ncbi:hypothetical protein [Caldithrix abyssi]
MVASLSFIPAFAQNWPARESLAPLEAIAHAQCPLSQTSILGEWVRAITANKKLFFSFFAPFATSLRSLWLLKSLQNIVVAAVLP